MLRLSLPSSIQAAALRVRSKAPYNILSMREALIWRTEELARNACDTLERDDFAVAAILTRAVTESTALVWRLWDLLETRDKHTEQELHNLLMRLLLGPKTWEDLPNPINIQTCIDRMEKRTPGVSYAYDILSEFVHPNWQGVFGLYSRTDEKEFTIYFGRGLRDLDENRSQITNLLVISIKLFEYVYKKFLADYLFFLLNWKKSRFRF